MSNCFMAAIRRAAPPPALSDPAGDAHHPGGPDRRSRAPAARFAPGASPPAPPLDPEADAGRPPRPAAARRSRDALRTLREGRGRSAARSRAGARSPARRAPTGRGSGARPYACAAGTRRLPPLRPGQAG